MRNQYGIENKENRPTLERRLSLKYSSNATAKNMSRMSIPARRESISNTSVASGFHEMPTYIQRQPRQSLLSCGSIYVAKPPKKQAILTNLMRKLDHEQELKQIIQSKIKNNKERDYVNYFEIYPNGEDIESRLKNHQEEVNCYKNLVQKLMEKISNLEKKAFVKKCVTTVDIGIQTIGQGCQTEPRLDFMDNLDKTLKILSGKKGN